MSYDHYLEDAFDNTDDNRSRRHEYRLRRTHSHSRRARPGKKSPSYGGLHQRRNKHWNW